jgi:hypothetical protein
MSTNKIIWTIREIIEILKKRQLNKFDVNIGVSGKRGNGKSTIIFKIFNSFKKQGFIERKHQVYAQKDVINLLAMQQFSYCWDDEAINSGYKRDFQNIGQKNLIKIITNYRDNHNIYASALPFFYSLDKDLRDLIFLHLHVIERGVAVLFLPLADQVHTQDQWDTKNNIKIEEQENKRIQKNPLLSFRYQRFSTFAGYVYFGPMSKKQEELYKKIKKEKRSKSFKESGVITEEETLPFLQRVYNLLIQGKLTKDGLIQACIIEGEKYSTILTALNKTLKDKGETKGPSELFRTEEILSQRAKSQINQLVPGFVNEETLKTS